LKAIRTLV